MSKKNKTNDEICRLLQTLKEPEKKDEEKPFDTILESGRVSITVTTNRKTGRLSFFQAEGQTELNFHNRKIETIENLANCMFTLAMKSLKLSILHSP